MKIQNIFPENTHDDIKQLFYKNKRLTLSGVNSPTAKAFLVNDLFRNTKNILWMTQDEEELFEISKDLDICFGGEMYNIQEKHSEKEIIHSLLAFYNAFSDAPKILLCSVEILHTLFPRYSSLKEHALQVCLHEKCELSQLVSSLLECGYEYSDETVLPEGFYRRVGDTLEIHPVGEKSIYKIESDFDVCNGIYEFDPLEKKILHSFSSLTLFPAQFPEKGRREISSILHEGNILISDELEEVSDKEREKIDNTDAKILTFTSFPKEDEDYQHIRYLSLLKFYNLPDFLSDLRSKIQDKWSIAIYTKRKEELSTLFEEEHIQFSIYPKQTQSIILIEAPSLDYIPSSFQNPDKKVAFVTDKEIFSLKKAQRNQSASKMNIDFITSLKPQDYIVHFDHGIGIFEGITQRCIENITREYLEIRFLGDDKLFIPIDQSDKISKYIHQDESEVRLSRLGGPEWKKQVKKAKKETAELAKELLKLYAKRAQVKRAPFQNQDTREQAFAESFPYQETPGQLAAIMDVARDMESPRPMDRLVCGDVGFGKTEVAMRAAFKAVEGGKQVACISPITILTEQHYHSFKKRMDPFGIRIEMISRFRSAAEQKNIIEKLRKGDIDIIIGTHRLLQKDIQFLNLGLVIIDEEQRFGVKQKEALKNLRAQTDILTLTATPIPRTLNMSLNKLRDITTITTPPPGRLPIITEVRRYSDHLVRETILRELERDGQIYFLHNRVETIEGIAEKLRKLIPEARFVVAHGQMHAKDLEDRILSFKEKKYDVLISSTIIENGIDFSNANTMIINNAERFGLSQLYQLRGRIGRSKRQAYAYLLYHTQKLNTDAKKRLRAIVEASELGAGFQIAMRDLEIRGAGEILGSSQHGTMKSIGVHHFLKMLQKTIEDMRTGKIIGNDEEVQESDVSIDLPLDAYIPNTYITDNKEKLLAYQKLAGIGTFELLEELAEDLQDEYGALPKEVLNLFQVLRMKLFARKAYIEKILSRKNGQITEVHLKLSDKCTPDKIMKALDYNKRWLISGSILKIELQDLGTQWVESLQKTLAVMAEKRD